jgi:hypothetical protein
VASICAARMLADCIGAASMCAARMLADCIGAASICAARMLADCMCAAILLGVCEPRMMGVGLDIVN